MYTQFLSVLRYAFKISTVLILRLTQFYLIFLIVVLLYYVIYIYEKNPKTSILYYNLI